MKFWRRIKTVGQKPFLDAAEKIADGYVDNQRPAYFRYALITLLIIALLILGLGWHWSDEPDLFDVRAETEKAFSHAIAGLLVNAELRAGRDTALGPSFVVRSAITIMELEGVSIHMHHIIHDLFSPWPNANESSQQ